MARNKLKLNDAKTECMVITSRTNKQTQPLSIRIGGETIMPKAKVLNLGGVLDSTMSMEAQVNKVIKSVYYHLRQVSLIRKHLTREACATLINATVTSRLDFQNGLLAGLSDKTLHRLQVAQNNAARVLARAGRREHITPILSSLHWLPVKQRIIFKVLTTVHKALHTPTAPSYIREQLVLYQPGRELRSSSDPWTLDSPRVRTQYGTRCFSFFGAKLWNSLPADLRHPQTVAVFKKKLKTFLFNEAFSN